MVLKQALVKLQGELTEKWLEAVFASFPFVAEGFIRTSQDKFANPVGHATRKMADIIYQSLIDEVDLTELADTVLLFARVRASQDIEVINSVAVIYIYKDLLRKYILPQFEHNFADYLELESKIDSLSLIFFNEYVRACQDIEKIKLEEMRRSVSQLTRLVNEYTKN